MRDDSQDTTRSTKSLERTRAGHVSCQFVRAGPPASLSCVVAIMRTALALVILAVAMCGCKTALVYTGSVKTGDDQKATEVSKVIEDEYLRQGLQREHFIRAPTKASYWSSWVTPVESTRYNALWVGDWVKDGTLFIRIVPQPYCNDASREFGEHIRGFMTTKFPDLEWRLTARSELDWFR